VSIKKQGKLKNVLVTTNNTNRTEIKFRCFQTKWFKLIAYINHTNYSDPQHTQIKSIHEIQK
jgi:hypothetical protein